MKFSLSALFTTLTIAIAGAKLDAKTRAQIEGRSLLPLLENPSTPWAERTLVSHVGRWPSATAPDAWWTNSRPLLVNKNAPLPKLNPFKELYWKQFGGGPSEDDLNAMNYDRFIAPKKGKTK